MPEYHAPGVYVEEVGRGPPPITGVSTSTVGMIGETQRGPTAPTMVTSHGEFERLYGVPFASDKFLPQAVRAFFDNGGKRCVVARVTSSDFEGSDDPDALAGIRAFADPTLEDVSILYAPYAGDLAQDVHRSLIALCEQLGRFAVIDAERDVPNLSQLDPRSTIADTAHAAFYFPWLQIPAADSGAESVSVPPGGAVCGVYARTDHRRGVWTAPANAPINGIRGTHVAVSTGQQDVLNPKSVNVIKNIPGRGVRVWGARTLSSDAQWRYVNVRRFYNFLEASITRGIEWSVFEPNEPALWARVHSSVQQFLTALWRSGAFPGTKPDEAFFVRVDETTMTASDIDQGRLVVEIGFAPLRPAEFVIFRVISQRR